MDDAVSLFRTLDDVRVEHMHGDERVVIGRVVFSMMFFMTRSTDPELRRQLVEVEAYCRRLVPLERYRWCMAEGESGKLYDLRDDREVGRAYRVWQEWLDRETTTFGLFDFDRHWAAPGHMVSLSTGRELHRAGWQSYFQFNVPLPWIEERDRPGLVQSAFCDLARILEPQHGQGGLCMAAAWDPAVMQGGGTEALYPLLHRFPDLMNGEASNMRVEVGDRMNTVNWLTAVHDDLVRLCGGREAVRAQLTLEGFEFADYPGGLVVQAGPSPMLGDRETGETMPLYGQLTRALRPARVLVPDDGHRVASNYEALGSEFDDDILRGSQVEYLTRFDTM